MRIKLNTSAMDSKSLREIIEVEQIEYLWGEPHTITPRLVEEMFGDGRRLLCVCPITFRPNHFVVRIDSRWTRRWRQGHDMEKWLDLIYEAIEEEYYEWPWAEEYGLSWHEDETANMDSRLNMGEGSSWCEMDWPSRENEVAA